MTGIPWLRRSPSKKSDSNLRRHSADVGALLRQQDSGGNVPASSQNPAEPATEPSAKVKSSNEIEGKESMSVRSRPRKSEERTRTNRFSILRFRNASDPALGVKARAQAQEEAPPPVPEALRTPAIITTAPTFDVNTLVAANEPTSNTEKTISQHASTPNLLTNFNAQSFANPNKSSPRPLSSSRGEAVKRTIGSNPAMRTSRVTFDEPERPFHQNGSTQSFGPPPSYDEHGLPVPPQRLSESSRSESSTDLAFTTTTTTHTVSTTTTFFRFSRRKKDTPLFPLPPKVSTEATRQSTDKGVHDSFNASARSRPSLNTLSSAPSTPHKQPTENAPVYATNSLAASAIGALGGANPMMRTNSSASNRSMHSNGTSPLVPPARFRQRSSTMSSLDRASPAETPRTSLTGRNSFSRLFQTRQRQNSEPPFGAFSRTSSPAPYLGRSSSSHPNSGAVSREKLVIPERLDDDTPEEYLQKIEEAVNKSVVASLLSRTDDAFHVEVLKRYMGTFNFYQDPMDMALRKLLMEVELPRETQQIDRVLQAFADRYHECNPVIYSSSENAYFIAFSLLILHTDVFNKNNKYKMQKHDYVKNTSGEGVTSDILEYFYDNISYTPFIHVEDDLDINGEKIVPHRPKRNVFSKGSTDGKRSKEPVDPYTLIIDNKLDTLRPNLADVLMVDDPYSYLGTTHTLDLKGLHDAFFRSAVLQIVSARSRPDAFLNPATAQNPQDASPGVVEIKVTKIGVLWRKDTKKKKTRSPWQEWGALLTGSQLYFFKNVSWIKNLMGQYEQHVKAGNLGIVPCIFTPPLMEFNPDSLLSTDDTVALVDRTYKKHKNAFMFVRHGGFQEYFLADNESEMNDWLSKLNYAAAFRTAGVRMRGVVGGLYDGQRSRGIRRLDSSSSGFRSVQTSSGEVSIVSGRIDPQLAAQIAAARRQVIDRKIEDSNQKLKAAEDQLAMLLRNAHHLNLLTPITNKTSAAVVVAAQSLSAKLQWCRTDIWRLRCHRDILLLDLEEERKYAKDQLKRHLSVNAPPETPPKGSRSPSSAFSDSPQSIRTTPTQASVSAGLASKFAVSENDLSRAVSQRTVVGRSISQSTARPATVTTSSNWELPPLSFEVKRASSSSTTSGINLNNLGSLGLDDSFVGKTDVEDSHNGLTRESNMSRRESSASSISQIALVNAMSTNETENFLESYTKEEKGKEVDADGNIRTDSKKEKDHERAKLRKSLQRTLRESTQGIQLPHHRSKKPREVSGQLSQGDQEADSASLKEKEEGLARGTGSFTVHGKKASVITFGNEWHTMPAEDRLKRHRSGASSSMASAIMGANGDRVLEASSLGKVIVSQSNSNVNSDDENGSAGRASQISRGSSRITSYSGKLTVVNPDAHPDEEGDYFYNVLENSSATLPEDGFQNVVKHGETSEAGSDREVVVLRTDDAHLGPLSPDTIASEYTFTTANTDAHSSRRPSRELEAVVVEVARGNDLNCVDKILVLVDPDTADSTMKETPTAVVEELVTSEPSASLGVSTQNARELTAKSVD